MASKRLSATITIGGAITGALKSAIGQTNSGLASIGKSIADLKARQKDLTRTISEQEKLAGPGSALRVQYANHELAVINKQIDALRTKQGLIDRHTKGMAAGKSQMTSSGMALGMVGLAMTPAIGAAKNAANFEYALQMIGNTADMTDAEIKRLGDTIVAVGARTGQSTDTMTKAMGFLVSAGMSVGTAQGMLDQIGKAATATGSDIEDLAKAAFVLNDALKIAPGKDMAAAIDTLAQAGKEGNVELKDMAKQLPVLGSGFAALKMTGREAAATMAAGLEIARKGAADADEAANNMKNFIAKLMSPETLKKAKKEFGLDLYKIITDAQSKGKNPFEAAMKSIMQATKGDQKKIGELFGDMQVQNFIRPMIQNWDEYVRIKDKALSAKGVVETDFDRVRRTSKQQMDEIANAADRATKAIGTALLPTLGLVMGALVPIIGGVADFVSQNGELVGNIATVVGTLGGLFAGTKLVALGIGAVTWAFSALKLAMATNPIGLALVLLATAAVMIYKNWEPIKAFFADLWGGIVTGAKAAFEWVMGKLQVVGEYWTKLKQFVGLGGDGQQDGLPATKAPLAPPALPAMATARASGPAITDNSTTTFQITQQPGQDGKALADEIMRKMKDRESVQRRSIMFDSAMGY